MKIKKYVLSVVAIILTTTCLHSVSAITNDAISSTTLADAEFCDNVYETLVDTILYKYGDMYSFANFEYEISQIRSDKDHAYIDINIITDMTLTQPPSESNYIIALQQEATALSDTSVRNYICAEIEKYIKEIENLYYNVTEASVFKYTVKIPVGDFQTLSSETCTKDYEFMYRVDISDSETINTPITTVKKIGTDNSAACKLAQEAVGTMVANYSNSVSIFSYTAQNTNTITYNRLDARDYALDHATDAPEFSKANGQGSDCANFVSKALNAGGFPTDTDNSWYPSSDGTTATCGINWMRTGYYDNGGVVPYMLDQGYFYEQSSESRVNAGSIMYWNTKSHVALVTYGDSHIIKYTQHSNVTLTESNAQNVVYESEDATFYMPNTANITVEE